MTNEELKEKIVDIVRYCYVNEKDYGYIFDIHIEEKINAIADALIAAGIGDVKTVREIGASATAMAVLEAAKAEHRAEVAERALQYACKSILKDRNDTERRVRAYFNAYLERAEKELAEERKDD